MGNVYQRMMVDRLPPWMQGPNLSALFGAIGAQLDANEQLFLDARLAGNPWAGVPGSPDEALLADGRRIECPPFVLPLHAAQRGLKLYATEPEISQRYRLSRWWQLHAARGTPWGQLDHARPYFMDRPAFPQMTIVFQNNNSPPWSEWQRITPSGQRVWKQIRPSNFSYDNQPTLRTRYWVFLEMAGTGFTPPITYGSGHTYGDGSLYGEGGADPFTRSRQLDIISMFLDWKAAHSWLAGVILVWPPTTLDIMGTPTQDADGRWSLPNGYWGHLVDPMTGKATRPYGYEWIYDNPA